MPAKHEKARLPLASLLSKSEKAQQSLKPDSWQHSMLEGNIQALRLGTTLLFAAQRKSKRFTVNELQQATTALTAMISKSVKAQAKFSPGTSPHTLQRNRINALRLAKKAAAAELKRLEAASKKK